MLHKESVAIERQCEVGLSRLLVLTIAVVADRRSHCRDPDLTVTMVEFDARVSSVVNFPLLMISFHDALLLRLFGTNPPNRAAVGVRSPERPKWATKRPTS